MACSRLCSVKKTGKGFYVYEKGSRTRWDNPELPASSRLLSKEQGVGAPWKLGLTSTFLSAPCLR